MGIKKKKGIASIELIVVIAILLAGLTIAVPLFLQRVPVDRESITRKKLNVIKGAIIGDPGKIDTRTRLSFGFVGDLGVPPSRLVYLLRNADPATGVPVYPTWQRQAPGGNNPLWYGWHGPYLNADADLVDGWGNAFVYSDSAGVSPLNNNPDLVTWPVIISSNGPDGIPTSGDEITLNIEQIEVRNFVSGGMLARSYPHAVRTSYNEQLNITFPNGTTLSTGSVPIAAGVYDTQPVNLRVPIGSRYFEIVDEPFLKTAALNGAGNSIVNFYAEEDIPFYENDFSDKTGLTFLGGGGGSWKTDTDADGDYLAYQGSAAEGTRVVAFGNPAWTDYKVEVEVSIADSIKIDGFGIDYRANYSGSPTPDSGYRFTYYPEPISYFSFKRIPTDFVPPEPNYGGYDFGYFRFTITVQTNPTTISHSLKIEKQIAGVLVTQTTISFNENRTADSVLSGQVGLMAFGQLQSIRFHNVIVSPL